MLDPENREAAAIGRARRSGSAAAISMTAVLLLLCVTQLGAQQSTSQASPGAPAQVTVPSGTRIMVRMEDSVDSDKSQPNNRFRGSLEANLMAGGVVVAPKGTAVFGRVLTAESAGRGTGGQLEFDLTDIMIGGQTYSLSTSSNQAQGESPSAQTGTAAKTGAAVGGLAGGLGGAVRGAGAGAVAGKISGGTTSGERVNIPAGTLVEFTLDHSVSLPVAQK